MKLHALRSGSSRNLLRAGRLTGALLALSLALAASGCKDKAAPSAAPGASGTAAAPAAAAANAKLSSKAVEHLPAGCEVAFHADVAKTLALPAAQKELIPALDELKAKSDTADAKKVQEMLKAADIDPKKDVHSVAVCASGVDGEAPKVVVVLGGEFRGESVVPSIVKVEATTEVSELDGRKLMTDKSKKGEPLLLTQAADGAVIIGNDRALVESALKTGTAYKSEYALPVESELSFNVSEALLTRGMAAAKGNPMIGALGGVKRVFGSLHLTKPGVELHLATASADEATKMSKGLNELLDMLKKGAANEKSKAGEMEALASAKARADGNDVVIDAAWSAEGVEKAASEMAKAIREANKKGDLPL